jgi:hypothetical protein
VLVDTVYAVQEWEEAGLRGQHLLLLPADEQRQATRRSDSPYRDYLVACFLLDAEARRHRGTELGRLETLLAVWIAEALLGEYHPAFQGGVEMYVAIATGKLAPTVLTDLLVLSWARHANTLRALSKIQEAHRAVNKAIAIGEVAELGSFAEAELANLHANILLDEGLDLDLACERAEHSIEVFASFDRHLAARAKVLKAMIQRQQPNAAYLTTFRQAIEQLDARRADAATKEAHTNYLFYLVREGHYEEASRLCTFLARPHHARFLANRLCVEGCIALALGNVNAAEKLFQESADLFTELGKPHDAMFAILYLASTRFTKGEPDAARTNLVAAEFIAHSCRHTVATAVQRLVRSVHPAAELARQILEIAFDAGGCLGPPQAKAPGT